MKYLDIFIASYKSYANYLWTEVTNPHWQNYFYWLIGVSLFFFLLEVLRPWRKNQARFRKDFWLDFFYMFFNFFLFSLIIYNAASDVFVNLFKDLLAVFGIENLVAIEVKSWPSWAYFLIGFLVRDFVQWWVHRLLHHSSFLWEFHKVHHSVEQMGFAAHLRYHWMENVVYRAFEYLPLALLGINLGEFFIIHIFTLAIGHFNHSNITVNGRIKGAVFGLFIGLVIASTYTSSWLGLAAGSASFMAGFTGIVLACVLLSAIILGPVMKYIFNSPEMHIWHHAYDLPDDRKYGVNFGITLAIWDYIWKTDYIPHNGKDIKLGFPGVADFPTSFVSQNLHGFGKKK